MDGRDCIADQPTRYYKIETEICNSDENEIEISGGSRRKRKRKVTKRRKKKKKVVERNGVVGVSSRNSLLLGA